MTSIYENATPRPWRRAAMGGSSTILSGEKPSRNDTRIPPYAYRDEHCVAYPFIGDRDGKPGNAGDVRLDFVCFSHGDAALIVHAVNNIERLEAINAELLKALGAIRKEAETANIAISLHRDGSGQGRIKVATAMHRIAQWSAATITRALEGEAGNGAS